MLGFCGCERFSCFLPPGGRGSGIIALTEVTCARSLTGGVSQPSNSQVGWLGGSTGARWSLPAIQLSRVLDGW